MAWARQCIRLDLCEVGGPGRGRTRKQAGETPTRESVSPTLQIQHFLLVRVPTEVRGLPLDYASYQIETGQKKQAIETLERGRALLWSDMRDLRTSTDQLRAADPALSRRIRGRQLEPRSGDNASQKEHVSLITHFQSLPGVENFLKPLSFDDLNTAATHGPVIIINQSQWRSDIIILHKTLPPSVISTPLNFHDRANQLKGQLLRAQKEKGLDFGQSIRDISPLVISPRKSTSLANSASRRRAAESVEA
ncbi:hypothetical protein EDB84DRAFT_1435094 [Lactarius hengduanensis]|nr:hypothetical protein EDB84DRAFT_1435094 [Lactarius hengduanensis]